MSIVEQLKLNHELLDKTISKLAAFFDISASSFSCENSVVIVEKDIELVSIYETKNVNITQGIWHKAGHVYPIHSHLESIEYLICSQGQFVVHFEDGTKLVSQGDCIAIPKNICHSVTPLIDDSIMIAICIPPESAYNLSSLKRARQ